MSEKNIFRIEIIDAYNNTKIELGINDEILDSKPYINKKQGIGFLRLFILRDESKKEIKY